MLATAIAIVGFVVGLTVRAGTTVDVAYHAAVLPLLVASLVAIASRLGPDGATRAAYSHSMVPGGFDVTS